MIDGTIIKCMKQRTSVNALAVMLPWMAAWMTACSMQHAPQQTQRAESTRPRARGAAEQIASEWRDEHGRIPIDAFERAHAQARQLRE